KQQKAIIEAELKISKQLTAELEAANLELRETQAQLVQSKKMASMGHLVAGISHEMNTPLGSIIANFDSSNRIVEMIREALDDEKITNVFENQPKLLKAMNLFVQTNNVAKTAAVRIDAIVKALRNFARLDEADIKECDLHKGIESTLILLAKEIHNGIKIVKNYGELPLVECCGREINQVLLSIILNAVQAIDGEGIVTIATKLENENAVISISDTGIGISKDKISKVFDPGYTTKGVGVGIGLGLSIAYNIMQSHNGNIELKSEVGQGTTFTIICPVRYTNRK
ncbi:MAG: sensor histidine kinase, partial [Candidatus Zixiibacteriota bacterium]